MFSLTILDASYNDIPSLPEVIGMMKVMEELNVAHNQIEKLPTEITGLKYLKVRSQVSYLQLPLLPHYCSKEIYDESCFITLFYPLLKIITATFSAGLSLFN